MYTETTTKRLLTPWNNNHQEREAHLDPGRTSMMEFFTKIVNVQYFHKKHPS